MVVRLNGPRDVYKRQVQGFVVSHGFGVFDVGHQAAGLPCCPPGGWDGGEDTVENAVALYPNCHGREHLAAA